MNKPTQPRTKTRNIYKPLAIPGDNKSESVLLSISVPLIICIETGDNLPAKYSTHEKLSCDS